MNWTSSGSPAPVSSCPSSHTVNASTSITAAPPVPASAREAQAPLGDDVALDLAGPPVYPGAERETHRVLDAATHERGRIEVRAEGVRSEQLEDVLAGPDERLRAEQLGH